MSTAGNNGTSNHKIKKVSLFRFQSYSRINGRILIERISLVHIVSVVRSVTVDNVGKMPCTEIQIVTVLATSLTRVPFQYLLHEIFLAQHRRVSHSHIHIPYPRHVLFSLFPQLSFVCDFFGGKFYYILIHVDNPSPDRRIMRICVCDRVSK